MPEKSPIETESLRNKKQDLRLHMRAMRRSLSSERRNEASSQLLELLEILSQYSFVFSFKSFAEEINTSSLNKILDSQGKLYLPLIQEDAMTFSSQKWGVLNTHSTWDSTIILVPAIAFDHKRYRLGYGKGHYDRFLAKISSHVPTIGIGFKEQLVNELPQEIHDIPLSEIRLY